MAYTYSKIATYTVGSGGVASIDFLNIPQTYTDLVLKLSARTAAGSDDAFYVRFNNTTTGYSGRRLWGNGSSSGSDAPEYFGTVAYSSLTANTFGNAEVYIPNYTGSTNKSASTDATQENNGTSSVLTMVASLWSNTAPITSIKITAFTGSNFAQYSTAHLYGIKAEL